MFGVGTGLLARLAQMDHDEEATVAQYNAAWARLRTATRGSDVLEAERLIRRWADERGLRLAEVDVVLMARVMSDVHWARNHPLSALALVWKHRRSRPPHRSLLWLWRPRFAG